MLFNATDPIPSVEAVTTATFPASLPPERGEEEEGWREEEERWREEEERWREEEEREGGRRKEEGRREKPFWAKLLVCLACIVIRFCDRHTCNCK